MEDDFKEEVSEGEDIVEKTATPEVEQKEDAKLTDNATGDEEAGHDDETDEEAEERRERNRARRIQNKENRKNYIDSLKRELESRDAVINDLATRVASVERQGQGSQMAQIDNSIKEAEGIYNHFKNVNRRAIELADGAVAVDAQEKMFAAQQRHNMLMNAKKNMASQESQPQPLDPRMKQHAEDWMAQNQWYDPSGQDMDSDLVLKLDERMAKEGWNPTTKAYWDELDARVKKYIPHRSLSGYNKSTSPPKSQGRVPVSGADNETGSSPNKGVYHLSAARVQALKDAGIYEDPKKRADAIARFKAYDKAAGLK
jgi:hypothetical protein